MSYDPTATAQVIPKSEFRECKNDHLDLEPFVECKDCGRKLHQICVLHHENIWPEGFHCDNCLKSKGRRKRENKFMARRLPTSKLGNYIEGRVNDFLKKRPEVKAGEVTIRVLSSSDKCVEVKPGMKNRYVETGEWPEQFPYRAKALFAWEEIDGVDVCFFGMHVQEYGSDSSPPNRRRVYLAYLDSVHFFRPKQMRTAVYHEILLGYLDYAKQLGYSMAHIWACPPSEGDDYIFHCHPPEQKIPKPKRLQDWYKKMLDKGLNEKIVVDYKDILKQANEDNFKSPAELPYFEGDFWPNVIEKSLKELEIEKYTQPNSNAGSNPQKAENDDEKSENMENEDNGSCDVKSEKKCPGQEENGSNKKKQNANKKSSKKQSQRKNNVHSSRNKGGASNQHSQAITNPARAWEAELTNKIYQTMEKHREVFFVIRLHSLADAAKLKPIQDPDGQINCDLMDGRDAFLTMAREKHYEFSSLRRAKFSSMCMLYELHNSSNDRFVYTCNVCKNHLVESRFHCTVCEDYDLCKNCYVTENHMHKMEKLEYGELGSTGSGDDSGFASISGFTGGGTNGEGGSSSATSNALSPADAKKQSVQRCVQSLVHACNCRDANCRMPSCARLKRITQHSRICKKRQVGTNQCPICRQLIALCCFHSKICDDTQNKCLVPFCPNIKKRMKQQQVQARMRQQHLMNSRIRQMTNAVNASAVSAAPSVVASISPATNVQPITTKPKPVIPSSIPNSQHASLTAAANNMSPGPNLSSMTPTGITSSGAGMGKPGSNQMNHVQTNNCYDNPSPLQPQTPTDSIHYVKQHVGNTVMPARPPMMQQSVAPPQRMIRHQMAPQGAQMQQGMQQGMQTGMSTRPNMMQQTMSGQRMMSYQMGPQGQQMAPQMQQQVQQQQVQPQLVQQQQQAQPQMVQQQQQAQARMRQQLIMNNRIPQMTNSVNASAVSSAPTVVASISPAAGVQPISAKPKPVIPNSIPNSQHATLNANANNMSPGPNLSMTPTGITSGVSVLGKPGSNQMNHVQTNNCYDNPSPLQTQSPADSMHYIKQHPGNAVMQSRPQMMQQSIGPGQRIIRHQITAQSTQTQQGMQTGIPSRPNMMQQTMSGQRILSYPMGPQGQMAPQPQQIQHQQVQPQMMQQHQHQHPQQQHQQMGWQSFPNQQNNMMHSNMGQQQNFIPQQQMNQMGNPQHMMRGGMPMGNMRAAPGMIRPVGVSRLGPVRYPSMNTGHVVNDQDMLAYPNQGNFINRNQQNQQELTPQEKLSHLIDKL